MFHTISHSVQSGTQTREVYYPDAGSAETAAIEFAQKYEGWAVWITRTNIRMANFQQEIVEHHHYRHMPATPSRKAGYHCAHYRITASAVIGAGDTRRHILEAWECD